MVKSLSEIQKIILRRDIILDVVPLSDEFHVAYTEPCVVLIYAIDNKQVFDIPINVVDHVTNYTKDDVYKMLNKVRGRIFCLNKKKVLHQFELQRLYDLSLIMFLETGEIIEDDEYNTSSHSFFKHKYHNHRELNKIIPTNNHVSKFIEICNDVVTYIRKNYDEAYYGINNLLIETLQTIEKHGLHINADEFNKHFPDKTHLVSEDRVYTEYNIFTSTGRPSNRFGGINFSALNKENGCRKSFTSRHGDDGILVMFDYSAYHPHIIGKLVKYNFPEKVSIYQYLGQYYFKTENLSEDQLKKAKTLTFQQLYGSISEEYAKIPYFAKIREYLEHRWQFFNEYGYIETPIFKRRITNKHLLDANPNKIFNYILQASETEYSMESLIDVNKYLNNKESKAILYTYDSVLFDIKKSDGKDTIINIKQIMESRGFPTKCYFGTNYHDMQAITI